MAILVIKILFTLITIVGLVWAFLVHLSNRHSRNIVKILGYFVACSSYIFTIYQEFILPDMSGLMLATWLISYGELIWFYDKEKVLGQFLEYRSMPDIQRSYFIEYAEMEMGSSKLKDNKVISKLAGQTDCITLEIQSNEDNLVVLEAMDYDYSVLLKQGFIDIEILGNKFALTHFGDKRSVKMNRPAKIYSRKSSIALVTLNKRVN